MHVNKCVNELMVDCEMSVRFRIRVKDDVLFNEAKPRGGGGGGSCEICVPLHRSKPLAICRCTIPRIST